MTLVDIVIKILLFFLVFYGAIIISSFVANKIRISQKDKKKDKTNK